MRVGMILAAMLMLNAPAAFGYCTVSGQPGVIPMNSRVVEMQDDEAAKQGRIVWTPVGVFSDNQIFAWLHWNNKPTGQGCVATFVGVRNDLCRGRVNTDFRQMTAYNLGVGVTDSGGNNRYPFGCSVELIFHVYDSVPDPNPAYNPNDPACPDPMLIQCQPVLIDPGFDYYILVDLHVTGQRIIPQGGNPSTPPNVSSNGNCPVPEPGETLPAYMFRGPGCAGPNARNSAAAAPGGVAVTSATSAQSASAVFQAAGVQRQQSPQALSAATNARLNVALQAIAARTQTRNGRPVIVRSTQ